MDCNEKILDFVKKQNSALNKRAGYNANTIQHYFDTLNKNGCVEVGWRESCGSTDYTMHAFRSWCQVIKKLTASGVQILETRQPQGNAYASLAGGFWNSIIYKRR